MCRLQRPRQATAQGWRRGRQARWAPRGAALVLSRAAAPDGGEAEGLRCRASQAWRSVLCRGAACRRCRPRAPAAAAAAAAIAVDLRRAAAGSELALRHRRHHGRRGTAPAAPERNASPSSLAGVRVKCRRSLFISRALSASEAERLGCWGDAGAPHPRARTTWPCRAPLTPLTFSAALHRDSTQRQTPQHSACSPQPPQRKTAPGRRAQNPALSGSISMQHQPLSARPGQRARSQVECSAACRARSRAQLQVPGPQRPRAARPRIPGASATAAAGQSISHAASGAARPRRADPAMPPAPPAAAFQPKEAAGAGRAPGGLRRCPRCAREPLGPATRAIWFCCCRCCICCAGAAAARQTFLLSAAMLCVLLPHKR